jgi:tetratricopeptide (TPR) repeat protein
VELRQRAIVADDPARWTQLAKVLDAKGDIDGALEAFRKVRALEPSREEAWLTEESLLDRADRRKELLATLIAHASDAVAAPARARAPILLRAARLALDLGDVDSAVVAAERDLEHTREADVLTPLLMDVYDKAGLTAERLATVKALADAMTDAEQQVLVRLRVARAEGAQP